MKKQNMKTQSELEFEKEVIDYLTKIGGVKQWEYVPEINSDEKLWNNFKHILETNNINKIDNGHLTDVEFDQVKRIINKLETPYQAGQFLYGVNGISEVEVDLESGRHVFLTVFDQAKVGSGNTVYQIVNQVERDKVITGGIDRRFDVTLLINGLPIIQLELKKATHTTEEAINQMEQYINERMYSGIFSTLQILIAMTPYDIKYMANTTPKQFNKSFIFNWQDEKDAHPIYDWKIFANKVLSIPMAHDMATRYMILDGTKNKECIKVMRPYQVYATKRVIEKISSYDFSSDDNKLGYVWHTTGSGKTITSFKTAWLASRLPNVGKVVFLVDRVALTNQTFDAYRAYDPIAGFEGKTGIISDTANVIDLKRKLTKKSDNNIIVTSIQKMARFVSRKDFKGLNENIIFIVDEAHRSTGDGNNSEGMLETIRNKIPTAGWIGYTGTPKFPETEDIFGQPLHIYTIKEAIADHNVLGFKVEFKETIPAPKNPTEEDIDDQIKSSVYDTSDEHVKLVVKDIFDHWKERSNNRKYNALFTVHVGGGKASTPRAMQYYNQFKEENKKRAEKDRLKVGISFSMDTSNGNNQLKNNEALRTAMLDYNKMFGCTFGLDTEKEYTDDLCRRLNKTADDGNYLDLVIVVDRLLTGFDAPGMNTLYVDRTLKGGGLIQAYSRTNRVHNAIDKPWGIVVNYRWPKENEEEMNKAFSVYSNRNSANRQLSLKDMKEINRKDGILSRKFGDIRDELTEVIHKISHITDSFSKCPDSEKQQDELIEEMKSYNRLLSQLKQFSQDDKGKPVSAYDNPEDFYKRIGMTQGDEIRLTSTILEEVKRRKARRDNIDISDIDLEMVHIHDVTINYDYLIELIAQMADAIHEEDIDKAKNTLASIQEELDKSDNIKFKDRIKAFIHKIFHKEYEFDKYPAPRSVEKMNDAIDNAQRATNIKTIRKFIQRWGLDNSTNPKELEKIIYQHQIGQKDFDKQGEFTTIMKNARNEYPNLADEEVASLQWVKYRSSLRKEFLKLADDIKKGE